MRAAAIRAYVRHLSVSEGPHVSSAQYLPRMTKAATICKHGVRSFVCMLYEIATVRSRSSPCAPPPFLGGCNRLIGLTWGMLTSRTMQSANDAERTSRTLILVVVNNHSKEYTLVGLHYV